jgi:hypothetical protein
MRRHSIQFGARSCWRARAKSHWRARRRPSKARRALVLALDPGIRPAIALSVLSVVLLVIFHRSELSARPILATIWDVREAEQDPCQAIRRSHARPHLSSRALAGWLAGWPTPEGWLRL